MAPGPVVNNHGPAEGVQGRVGFRDHPLSDARGAIRLGSILTGSTPNRRKLFIAAGFPPYPSGIPFPEAPTPGPEASTGLFASDGRKIATPKTKR
jgi:hypothetical protein